MYQAVLTHFEQADVVIKAAAVADYQVVQKAPKKIKKDEEHLTLELVKTKDILKSVGREEEQADLSRFRCGNK